MLTWHPADVEHVADDVLSVLVGLLPGHPHRGGRQGFGLDVGGLARQAVGPEHGEASAGLRGAGAVLRDALVDGLVILADAVYGECAAGRPGEKGGRGRGRGKRRRWSNILNAERYFFLFNLKLKMHCVHPSPPPDFCFALLTQV